MKAVAIIDGLAEGPWHHKIMNAALSDAGYTVIDQPEKADIVIAHSAGCFFIPETEIPQTIMLIGPPYWPGKSLLLSLGQKIWLDAKYRVKEKQTGYFIQKNIRGIVYILSDIAHVFSIGSHARKRDLGQLLESKNTMLVRNIDDAWCTPEISKFTNLETQNVYELPGEHDDCWIHPQPYIDLLFRF